MIGDYPNARLISAIAGILSTGTMFNWQIGALEDVNLLRMLYPYSIPTDFKPFRNMMQDEV
jgi:hypothetical protein